jgi:hypothetical protein
VEGEERKPLIKSLKYTSTVKNIIPSVYSNNPITAEYQKYGFSAVITKPYDVDTMKQTLRSLLSEKK